MCYGIGQAGIPIVAARKVAEGLPGTPVFHPGCWNRSPGKRVTGHGLVDSIHPHRVVCGCYSESIAVGRVGGDVNAAARIHEPSLAIDGETHAESVRMPMTAAPDTMRPRIHDDLLRVGFRVCDDVESAVPESGRMRRWIS